MAYQTITDDLTTWVLHPSANDVASTPGQGVVPSEVQIAALIDALNNSVDWVVSGFDYSGAVGLVATFNAGVAILEGRRVSSTGTFPVTLTAASTNHVWLTWTETAGGNVRVLGVEVNTTGTPPSTPYLYLATLTTDGSGVTGDTDERPLSPPYAALVAGVLPQAQGGLGADVSAFSGLVLLDGAGGASQAAQGTDYYKPGGTDFAVADGGTGASAAAGARTNLGVAPNDAAYITQSANGELSAEQSLAALADGMTKVTTGTGTLSTAADGTDYYKPGGTDVALADGGTGASLSDPGADRIMFWDDSAGSMAWLEAGTGFSLSGTDLGAGTVIRHVILPLAPTSGVLDVRGVSSTAAYGYITLSATNAGVAYWCAPAEFTTLVSAVLYLTASHTTEPTIRVTVGCRADGEHHRTGGSINTTTSAAWHSTAASTLVSLDISSLFTGLAAGDVVAIGVDYDSGSNTAYAISGEIVWN